MRGNQTTYQRGFRAGLIGQNYLKGDQIYKTGEYFDWWDGWQAGKAARPEQPATESARPPRPRSPKEPEPQPVRRRHYLKAVGRLSKVPF